MATTLVKSQVVVVACGGIGQPPCPSGTSFVGVNPLTTGGGDWGDMPNPENLPTRIGRLDRRLDEVTGGKFRVMLLPNGATDARVVGTLEQVNVRIPRKTLGTTRTRIVSRR